MLERCFDVERINAVVNDPAVRPHVGAPEAGDLDVSELIARPEHWFLMGDHGGFMLGWSAPETREVHTFVLPEGRGKWADAARTAMLDYAQSHGTKMLWTKIAENDRHVIRYARQGGMQFTGDVLETFGKPYRIYRMELN
jgi:hypothetical protein